MSSLCKIRLALLSEFFVLELISWTDRKARSSLNQQQTTSGGYMGGNRGKISWVKRSHSLTGLLVESFSLLK